MSCGRGTIACGCGHGCVVEALWRHCGVIVASLWCCVCQLLSLRG
jgi:hypothetical protein